MHLALTSKRNPRNGTAALAPVVAIVLAFFAATTRVGATEQLITINTDFSTGSVSQLGLTSPWSGEYDVAPICGDAVARWHLDRLYVVNRFGCDAIQVITPDAGWPTVSEFSVGVGTNPQDIAVITPTRAYVSRYESNWLLEVNPVTGALVDSISLAAYADVDGLVEQHRLFTRGDRLYVQLQRLDRRSFPYEPAPPSYLAVIDLTTRLLVDVDPIAPGTQAIALAATNPIAPMSIDLTSGTLLVPCTGAYGVMDDGGIERVDLFSNRSEGFLLPGSAMNGDLVDFCQWSGARGYVILSDAGFNTALHAFDPRTKSLIGPVYAPGGFVLSDCITHPNGSLYLTDRDFFDPGVRVFDAASGAPLGGGVTPTGLPPIELLIRPDFPSDAPEVAHLFETPPWPNPSAGGVAFALTPSAPGSFVLEVLDASGRRVRRSPLDGRGVAVWDGRNDAGSRVPAGAYVLRLLGPDGRSDVRSLRIVR